MAPGEAAWMVPRTRLMATGRSRWQVTLQRALRIVAVLFVAIHLVILVKVLRTPADPLVHASAFLFLLALLVGLTDVGWGQSALSEPLTVRRAPAFVAVVTLLAMALGSAGEPGSVDLMAWVGLAPPIIAGYVAAMWPRRWAVAPIIALAAVMPLTALVLGRPLLVVDNPLGPAVLTLVGGMGALLTIRALRGCAYAADHWVDRAVAEQAESMTVAAGERAARDVERFIHDEVLHTLRAVALGPEAVSSADTRTLATDLLDRFDQLAGSRQVRALSLGEDEVNLTEMASEVLLGLAPGTTIDAWGAPRLPVAPAEAMVAAMAEAVRNVVRHSGAPNTLRVRLRADPDGARIIVQDRGRGFDVDRAMSNGLGLPRSIVDRMHDVGGSAEIRSRPAGGTRVALTWANPSLAARVRTAPSERAMLSDVLQGLALGPFPVFGWAVFGCWVTVSRSRHPAALVAGTAVVLVLAICAARLTARGGPGRLMSAALSMTTVLAIIVNALSVPPGAADPLDLFLIGPAAQLLFVTMVYRPLRETAPWALATSLASTFAAVHVAGPGELTAVLPALVPVGLTIGAGLVFRWIGNRYRETAGSSMASMALSRAQQAVDHARRRAVESQVAEVVVLTRPLLEGVSSGRLELGDRGTQQAAEALETRLRDSLLLPDAPSTRRGVSSARVRGWTVRIRAEGSPARDSDRVLGTLLHRLSEQAPDEGTIDLTMRLKGALPIISVLVRPASDRVWESVQDAVAPGAAELHRDHAYVQILMRASSNETTSHDRALA